MRVSRLAAPRTPRHTGKNMHVRVCVYVCARVYVRAYSFIQIQEPIDDDESSCALAKTWTYLSLYAIMLGGLRSL